MDNSLEIVQNIINKSGNSFHVKVVSYLRQKGWNVLVSPYYNDNVTDKPREIDLIIEKSYPVNGFARSNVGRVSVRLFIECKYIQDEIVLWFDFKDNDKAVKRVIKVTGLDAPDKNILINTNHLITTSKVAKLFSSKQNAQTENDLIYKAINQCLNATIYYQNKHDIFNSEEDRLPVLRIINYPLIICSDFEKVYRTDFQGSSPQKVTENFSLEVNYAYLGGDKKSLNEYFLIDVVNFTKIDEYITNIEKNDIQPVLVSESDNSRLEYLNRDSESPSDWSLT